MAKYRIITSSPALLHHFLQPSSRFFCIFAQILRYRNANNTPVFSPLVMQDNATKYFFELLQISVGRHNILSGYPTSSSGTAAGDSATDGSRA